MGGTRYETLFHAECATPTDPETLALRIEPCQTFDHKGDLFYKIPRSDLHKKQSQKRADNKEPRDCKRKRRRVDISDDEDEREDEREEQREVVGGEVYVRVPYRQLSKAQLAKVDEAGFGFPTNQSLWVVPGVRSKLLAVMQGNSISWSTAAEHLIRFCQKDGNALNLKDLSKVDQKSLLQAFHITAEFYNVTITKELTQKLETQMRNSRSKYEKEGFLTVVKGELIWSKECDDWEPVSLEEATLGKEIVNTSMQLFRKAMTSIRAGKDAFSQEQREQLHQAIGCTAATNAGSSLLTEPGSTPSTPQRPSTSEATDSIGVTLQSAADREFEEADQEKATRKPKKKKKR